MVQFLWMIFSFVFPLCFIWVVIFPAVMNKMTTTTSSVINNFNTSSEKMYTFQCTYFNRKQSENLQSCKIDERIEVFSKTFSRLDIMYGKLLFDIGNNILFKQIASLCCCLQCSVQMFAFFCNSLVKYSALNKCALGIFKFSRDVLELLCNRSDGFP